MFKKFFRSKLQKGQSMVFLAISAPILFFMIAAAADFGWLYLNQVRLQNAADAAATAGAKQLIAPAANLEDYYYTNLVSNYDKNFQRLVKSNVISLRNTHDGDRAAQLYAHINLAEAKELDDVIDVGRDNLTTGNYPNEHPSGWGKVQLGHILYGSDLQDFKTLYYVIVLSEKLNHLFPGIFDYFERFFPVMGLEARAMAVAKITHYRIEPNDSLHGISLYEQMKSIRSSKEIYVNWQQIKEYAETKLTVEMLKEKFNIDVQYDKNGNVIKNYGEEVARMIAVGAKGNEYVEGNFYRTEMVTLHGWTRPTNGQGVEYGKKTDQRNYGALFVDFRVDTNDSGIRADRDPPSTETEFNLKANPQDRKILNTDTFKNPRGSDYRKISGKDVFKLRIHDVINVGKWTGSRYDFVYNVRGDIANDKDAYDPLDIYIESEESYSNPSSGNTVHQMIINVNAPNTASNTRPIFFYYDGPQKYSGKGQEFWNEDWRETWKHLLPDSYSSFGDGLDDDYFGNQRNSLPVILNLYADFRGVLFVPNSPVVINGHNHSFEGFIVAQKFLKLKTATDFPAFAISPPSEYKYFKDDRGNEYYRNPDGLAYYHKKAEGCIRYIQVVTSINSNNQRVINYRDVIYTKDPLIPASKNPVDDDITLADNIYMTPTGEFYTFSPSVNKVAYRYTWVNQEKANPLRSFKTWEKPYVKVHPMYIDEFGNVQYKYLDNADSYNERPVPRDSEWHSNYNSNSLGYSKVDDLYEVILKPSAFNIRAAKYNSYDRIVLVDYTKLNDKNRNINDVFFTTIRADWVD